MLNAGMAIPTLTGPVLGAAPSFAHEAAALQPLVRAVIASLLHEGRDHPDVLDCTNEVMRRALESSSRCDPSQGVRPWLLGIARHVAIDCVRQRRREALRRPSEPSHDDGELHNRSVEQLADPSPSADDLMLRAERETLVREAIGRLSEGQRQAMLLFHVEGLGYQQIAARLEVPLGTVATWIARGRRSIAEALAQEVKRS